MEKKLEYNALVTEWLKHHVQEIYLKIRIPFIFISSILIDNRTRFMTSRFISTIYE